MRKLLLVGALFALGCGGRVDATSDVQEALPKGCYSPYYLIEEEEAANCHGPDYGETWVVVCDSTTTALAGCWKHPSASGAFCCH